MELLPNDSGENGVSIAISQWGLGSRIIFGGKKLHRARFCMYVLVPPPGDDSELVYAGSVLYGSCVKKA